MRRYWQSYWHMLVLGCWAVACFAYFAPHGGGAWHFFSSGSSQLFGGPAGLHLYADFPELQIGPAAFVLAQVIRQFSPHQGVFAAEVTTMAMGLYVLFELTRIAFIARSDLSPQDLSPPDPGTNRRRIALRGTLLTGGAVFLAGWAELSTTFTHLDDALALVLSVLAVRAALAERPLLVGLCVGLAADSKPWALAFLPVMFMLPARSWVRAAASALVTVAAMWLPFALADQRTVAATTHYTIRNVPGSALRAMGVRTPRTPGWDRSAQLLAGWALAAAAVLRGRWPAVILLGVGARIALDPADWGYYTAGVLLGALLWDLAGTAVPVPAWTVTSFATLTAVHAVTSDSALLGLLRLGLVVAFTSAILLGPPRRNHALDNRGYGDDPARRVRSPARAGGVGR